MNEVIVPEIVNNYDKAITLAIEQKSDLATIEKFMDLRERWEKNEAMKAYYKAMAAFKANPPEIEKDKHVKYTTQKGITEYDHASLGNVAQCISSALGTHGLSAAWKTQQNGAKIIVTCRISHSLGYGEETSLEAAHDDSGGKNAIQSLGSTITYLERYTLLALTGLATQDQDDDGKETEDIKYISDIQQTTINGIVEDKKVDSAKFLEYMKAKTVAEIKESDYQKALNALKAAKGAKK